MMTPATLDAFLTSFAHGDDPAKAALAPTVRCLAEAAIKIRHAVNSGVPGKAAAEAPRSRAGNHQQDGLQAFADDAVLNAMRLAPVTWYASATSDEPVLLADGAPLAVAVDPFAGSADLDANVPFGTIFSILPATEGRSGNPAAPFLQPGSRQLGAGFFLHGPRLALVLSLGSGTHVFVLSNRLGSFVQAHESRIIPDRAQAFAIDAANYRHWDEAVRLYMDDCLQGDEGPRGRDFTMRWTGSLAAECYRILISGGVYLSPGDRRRGFHQGRLRLVHEANPIAFLVEQAGGAASDSVTRILDHAAGTLDQRTPMVFGCSREVDRIARYHTAPSAIGERAPLFGNRGLFRA